MDGFDPSVRLKGEAGELNAQVLARAVGYRKPAARAEIDRWILSELEGTVRNVVETMDAYDNFTACQHIASFIDGLSNWYVRSSRHRYWSEDKSAQDKIDAYWTLYESLLTVCKLIAPFTPFIAETLWRNLAGVFGDRAVEGVHLCSYPTSNPENGDPLLSQRMHLLRTLASLGRNARMEAKLKVRQPLATVEVVLADTTHQKWLEEHDELLRKELNVKKIEYTQQAHYIEYLVQPNFKRLGPRLGKFMPAVKQQLSKASGAELRAELQKNGKIELHLEGEVVSLDAEDLQITIRAKEGWAAADDQTLGCAVVLNTEITPQLLREGYARDLVRLINERRKELCCEYNDRIRLAVVTDSEEVKKSVEENLDYIQQETLAAEITFDSRPDTQYVEVTIADAIVVIYIVVV
jgi:isoleucyl-tRNA synthetase